MRKTPRESDNNSEQQQEIDSSNLIALSQESIQCYYEFAKTRFEQEMTRTLTLRSAVALYVTTTSLISAGFAAVVLRSCQHLHCHWLFVLLGAFTIAGLGSFLLIVYYFWRFSFGHQHGYPPHTSAMAEYFLYLQKYYETNHGEYFSHLGSREEVEARDVKLTVTEEFGRYADLNFRVNNVRAGVSIKMGRRVVVFLVLLLLAFGITIGIEFYHFEDFNSLRGSVMPDDDRSNNRPQPGTTGEQPPPKNPPPRGHLVTEGEERAVRHTPSSERTSRPDSGEHSD